MSREIEIIMKSSCLVNETFVFFPCHILSYKSSYYVKFGDYYFLCIFPGVLITVNYISIIVYLPGVVVMHHLYFEKYKCCCCGKSSSAEISDVQQDPEQDVVRDNFIVRFYSGPYFRFVENL